MGKNDPWVNLAIGIIKNAIMDYEIAKNTIKREGWRGENSLKILNAKKTINDVERFFNSQWFVQLTKADGPSMLEQIKKNYDKYGRCLILDETYK